MDSPSPIRGAGLGLRTPHLDELLNHHHENLWLELLADNWLYEGLTRHYLDAFVDMYPLTIHSVGLSIGGCEPLDMHYLQQLKDLLILTKAPWLSDHLCFTNVHDYHFPDLLPLPYTEESIKHVVERINIIQDFMGMQLVIENVSSYIEYNESTLNEAEFISAICHESDCGLLLDLNNVYVSERNHGHCSWDTIKQLPLERVKEIHLAGFSDKGTYVVDTHDHAVHKDVWQLFSQLQPYLNDVPTLIEWDSKIPELHILLSEAKKAQDIIDKEQLKLTKIQNQSKQYVIG